MAEICVSVAAKVAEYLVGPILRPLGYLCNYRLNITDLNQQIDRLRHASVKVEKSVEEANRQGDEIFPGVQEWLTYAEGIIQNRDDFNEEERKSSKSCFYLMSRYRLSKRAKKRAEEIVVKISEAHGFGDRVSYRPSPPPLLPLINSASFKDYEAFKSRESTFNQIMEALRNEDMRMIGVWGMGGVGKTTIVKQVAKQADEEKLFDKVVMALNISQTPNISEIQGKIARMLGLTFDKDEERADRLRQSLKKREKILVILDDLWEKLELGDIGIPYGDDHKGCKLLLTSRERRVLDTDMCTQQEFHVRHLNEEEAWSLFKRTAGDFVESPDLQRIAINIVKKCDGLPVAIVTIANALKKQSAPVWENALEELLRSAPTNIRGVSKNVYSCLELSYNHLEGDEAKSLFLLCGLMGVGYISMDRLLQYAMGLSLFKGSYSWEKAANKLTTLVENLKVSSLLLDNEDGDNRLGGSLLFDEAFVRMHDIVRDVARSIACKDPHRFVVKEVVGSQEAVELQEWKRMDECRNCSRISLICRKVDALAQGLVCPQLEFFLLNSRNYLKIPDDFFQDTEQLRVLDLCKVSLAPSPSSLGFLSNLQTLSLSKCRIKDIAVIGELKRLQVLSLAESSIEQLPKEMMQLSDLRVLGLQHCYWLRVIPRNVISSLSRLEYLSMKGSPNIQWEPEGLNTRKRNNARLSELKHLSGLRTLEVRVLDPNLLPKDVVLFDNVKLNRYSIKIGDHCLRSIGEYNASRRSIGEKLELMFLDNLEAVCHGPIRLRSFVNLRILRLWNCKRMKYVFFLPTNRRESNFPRLQSLSLGCLIELISFYSTGSIDSHESVEFFNQKVSN